MWNKYGQLIIAAVYSAVIIGLAVFKPDYLVVSGETWDIVGTAGWGVVPVTLAYLLFQGAQYLRAKGGEAEAVMWQRRHKTKRDNKYHR